jgi:hypothetical protein
VHLLGAALRDSGHHAPPRPIGPALRPFADRGVRRVILRLEGEDHLQVGVVLVVQGPHGVGQPIVDAAAGQNHDSRRARFGSGRLALRAPHEAVELNSRPERRRRLHQADQPQREHDQNQQVDGQALGTKRIRD